MKFQIDICILLESVRLKIIAIIFRVDIYVSFVKEV